MDWHTCTSLVLLLLVAVFSHSGHSSSFYVGRHASGSRAALNTFEDCDDFDARKCQKIVYWLGHKACKDQSSDHARSLRDICPKSCGLCGCKDVGMFCTMLSSLCDKEDETGKFLQHNCPKTCKKCHKGEATSAGSPGFAALL